MGVRFQGFREVTDMIILVKDIIILIKGHTTALKPCKPEITDSSQSQIDTAKSCCCRLARQKTEEEAVFDNLKELTGELGLQGYRGLGQFLDLGFQDFMGQGFREYHNFVILEILTHLDVLFMSSCSIAGRVLHVNSKDERELNNRCFIKH